MLKLSLCIPCVLQNYVAIQNTVSYLDPTEALDIYSFSILAYEVAFTREPWPSVTIQLIDSVRRAIDLLFQSMPQSLFPH